MMTSREVFREIVDAARRGFFNDMRLEEDGYGVLARIFLARLVDIEEEEGAPLDCKLFKEVMDGCLNVDDPKVIDLLVDAYSAGLTEGMAQMREEILNEVEK